MSTILVKIGRRFYKARVNPTKEKLRQAIGRKNPLLKSKRREDVNKNIAWLMKHPKELTAKTKKMKRKQAIAIALSVWRRAQ